MENEEGAQGELYEFAYKIDGEDQEIVVATTRPETMLGDTAVAVHPTDPRYKHLHGKKLVHPFVDRKVPVITDAILVDMKFGTGAVKVTPAHDFNDFATGKRHGLEEISIFDLDGKVNANGGRFQGLDRKKARTEVKKALDELGLARGSKPHVLALPRCQRTNDVVEPMISTQWFCRMEGDGGARRSRRCGAERRRSSRRSGRRRTTTSSRTSRTGASRGSCGGATRSPRGMARMARSRSCARAAGRSAARGGRKILTCSTPGSRPRCGP